MKPFYNFTTHIKAVPGLIPLQGKLNLTQRQNIQNLVEHLKLQHTYITIVNQFP